MMAEKSYSEHVNNRSEDQNKPRSNPGNSCRLYLEDDAQQNNAEKSNPLDDQRTPENVEIFTSIVNDLVIIEKDDLLGSEEQNNAVTSDKRHGHESPSAKSQYDRSMSTRYGSYEQRPPTIQKGKSVSGDSHNNEQKVGHSDNKQMPVFSATDATENEKSKFTNHFQLSIENSFQFNVSRLLQPTCEGIRERIELLGELVKCKKLDCIPDVYDQMAQIIEATERNERLKEGPNGERLHYFTNAAKSNLNADLHELDIEIQRQFGLHSVEVTGDGACAFRAALISGMQQPDLYHSEVRERVIEQVLKDMPYYSTVLRPGETVIRKELEEWIQTMRDPNTYADEMANIALADRYHMQLVIFRAGELLTVVNPRDGLVKYTAFLVNVGTHYKALVPRHELDQARKTLNVCVNKI